MINIRNATVTTREEFVMCVNDFNIPMEKEYIDSIDMQCYSDENDILKTHNYLSIAYTLVMW